MNRRRFLLGSIGAGTAAALAAACSTGTPAGRIRGATAITRVFGDGQKLIAVAVEYDTGIATSALSTSAYSVAGRTVTKVYANTATAVTASPADGRYVIVELSPSDPVAQLWGLPPGSAPPSTTAPPSPSDGHDPYAAGPALGSAFHLTLTPAAATVTQTGPITTTDRQSYAAGAAITTGHAVDPLVDLFEQKSFTEPTTGRVLRYNLFVPRNYNPSRRYPLVLFMHDASIAGGDVKGPLVQGLGAVCWADPQDQARHECFVVAPQYDSVVISDDYRPSPLFDTTISLVHDLLGRYSIDPSRLHATGQSMGAMMALGMNIRYPDLFASSYIVAGQWPADQAAPLARKRLWVTVSQGDTKAYPGENEIMAVVEQAGAEVTTAAWDGRATPEQAAIDVAAMASRGAPINYVSLLPGTVPAAGDGPSQHFGTWRIAYSIPGIRDWLLRPP
ncbi:hypothetical protein K7711_16110 [Nocardia sp. CA2R105]|uniref:hypothetical protein n=1 Tax=Nocardia coffeae TaxID=2873381 RepID=UPI001CA6B078|nr:hypothetical protein [Nocardia coffeae]MBY8858011.1 hypothetical protein [Nocardia coffeae]